MRPKAFDKVEFDRKWTAYIYIIVTLITSARAIFHGLIGVGAAALGASALCYFGAATFAGSFLARREKNWTPANLAGIGVIAAALAVAGMALMVWSGFWLEFFGLVVPGPYWAGAGVLIGLLTTSKKDAM